MNNVIIITRSLEYLDNSNREAFGKNIKKELEGETNFSAGKYAVKKTLAAISNVSSMGDNYFSAAIEAGINIDRDDKDIKKQLIIKCASDSDMDGDLASKKCYVKIEHDPYKLVLFLWDVLGKDPSEKIEHFDLFIDAICNDCGISDNGNYLYIHDKQLGIDKDIEILSNGEIKKGYEEYGYFKNHFKYVAAFRHAPSGYFVDRILKFRFGERTRAKQISELETEATTFAQLRQQADLILNNDANKSKKL